MSDMTVNEAAMEYVERYARPRGQCKAAMAKLRAPLLGFGQFAATEIDDDHVDAYVQLRRRGGYGPGGRNRPVSDATIRMELAQLQAALNWTLRKVLRSRITYRFEKPEDSEPRRLWLDEGQEAVVLDALPGEPVDVRLFTRMGLDYGVRRGAMLGLQWSQIDWRAGVIDFNPPGARKMRKRKPRVPLTPEITADLREAFGDGAIGPVLRGEQTLRLYAEMMARLDLAWATPHVLKHTFVTLRRRAGVDWDTIGKVCATDPRTLQRVYGHFGTDDLMAAITRRR